MRQNEAGSWGLTANENHNPRNLEEEVLIPLSKAPDRPRVILIPQICLGVRLSNLKLHQSVVITRQPEHRFSLPSKRHELFTTTAIIEKRTIINFIITELEIVLGVGCMSFQLFILPSTSELPPVPFASPLLKASRRSPPPKVPLSPYIKSFSTTARICQILVQRVVYTHFYLLDPIFRGLRESK